MRIIFRILPFGNGWIGEKSDRIYAIEYETGDGEVRQATVKTSMLSGVYFTDDRPIGSTSGQAATTVPTDEAEALRAENVRLKTELERLASRRE